MDAFADKGRYKMKKLIFQAWPGSLKQLLSGPTVA